MENAGERNASFLKGEECGGESCTYVCKYVPTWMHWKRVIWLLRIIESSLRLNGRQAGNECYELCKNGWSDWSWSMTLMDLMQDDGVKFMLLWVGRQLRVELDFSVLIFWIVIHWVLFALICKWILSIRFILIPVISRCYIKYGKAESVWYNFVWFKCRFRIFVLIVTIVEVICVTKWIDFRIVTLMKLSVYCRIVNFTTLTKLRFVGLMMNLKYNYVWFKCHFGILALWRRLSEVSCGWLLIVNWNHQILI